ncbi:MAG: hypothetical protein AMJ38_02200 [Dehalococcoidia bacterium DG_22]|nr:MAG: hypothetical protein AMJ38_02200 [Dehalococcoidia bacterium DG_22]
MPSEWLIVVVLGVLTFLAVAAWLTETAWPAFWRWRTGRRRKRQQSLLRAWSLDRLQRHVQQFRRKSARGR